METHDLSPLSACSEVTTFYEKAPDRVPRRRQLPLFCFLRDGRDADPLNSNPPLNPIMESASPSPATSPSGYGMVELELDAAVALANLAGQAAAGKSRKQSVSPGQDDPTRAGLFSSFSAAAAAAADDRETEERFKHRPEMASSSSVNLSARRRTRQGLTEAEKEERRMRRVLANRESARQTIRRRQALKDELNKKFAYLRLENDTMRLEKELAMKEYLSLWDANAQLKEQIANTARGEIDINSEATETEVVESSSACPTIAFFDQSTTGSVSPLRVPPCSCFHPLPDELGAKQIGGESSLVPGPSEAGAEKEARGDSQVKAAASVDGKGKPHQTPDHTATAAAAAAAAAEARKRRKELTKLKQHHAR